MTNRSNDDRYVGRERPPVRSPRARSSGTGSPLDRIALGRIALTPLRLTLGGATLVSVLVVLYGLTVRDASQLPVLTAGGAISGIVFAVLAGVGAWTAYHESAAGRSGRAFGYAFLGGIAALSSAAAFAGAVILGLLHG